MATWTKQPQEQENKNTNWGGTFIDSTGIRSKSTKIDILSNQSVLFQAL